MTTTPTPTVALVEKVRAALLGLFVADALAMPTHWYYGGTSQILSDFGKPIMGFVRSQRSFPGSIMNKSNTGGAGRGSDKGTIIGDVINHGKKKYWTSGLGYHYHHTLAAGENTLEAQLVRVLMKSIVACEGNFDANHFCKAYVKFMTTPGSHNDTYASTAHRQFFENFVKGRDPMKCASNDGHNTDAIDALVLPLVVGLATLGKETEEAVEAAKACGEVTRSSKVVQAFVSALVSILRGLATTDHPSQGPPLLQKLVNEHFDQVNLSESRSLVTACYIRGSVPTWLHMVHTFATDVRQGFIVNANAGGENVHRGELLGLLLGFIHGSSQPFDDWVADLKDVTEIKQEIDEFIKAVFPTFAEEEEEEVPTSELSVADQKVSATAAATTTTTTTTTTTAVDAEENKSDAPAQ